MTDGPPPGTALGGAGDEIALGTAPAGPRDRRLAVFAALLLLLLFVATAPFAGRPLVQVPAFVPAYDAAVLVLDLLTAVLLWSHYRETGERALLALACGFAFTPVVIAAHGLSFPDAFVPGSLIGDSQTTAWLWMVWHSGFPLFAGAYAALRGPGEVPAAERSGAAQAAIAASVAAAAALTAATLAAERLLPPLMLGSLYQSPATRWILAAGWVLHVAALVLLAVRTRFARLLDLWLGIVLVASLIDLALSALLVTGRYQLGFYAGRFYGLVAAVAVLAVLLRHAMGLQNRAARAAAAQTASEEKYRTLFQSIDEGFCLLEYVDDPRRSSDYRFLEVNEAFEKLTGKPNVVGKLRSEVSPDTEDYWIETYAEVARTGVARRVENHHEETGRWYDVFISRVGGEGSRQICLVFNDTTERKRAEIELREREERQRFLLTLGDALRTEAAARGKIEIAASRLGERLAASRVLWAEYDHDEGVAHIFSGWFADGALPFPPVVRLEDFEGEVLNDLRAGRIVRVDDIGALADEPGYAAISRVGVQALLSVPLLIDGTLTVNISIHQHEPRHWTDEEVVLVGEVAERLWAEVVRARAEAALRESEEKYRTLFEEMDEGFALCELVRDDAGRAVDFRYIDLNPALMRHVGIAPETLRGRLATEAFPDRDPWYLDTYAQVVESGQSVVEEHYFEHVDRWLRLNVFPRGGDRFAVLYSDVTDRNRAEMVLRESERRQAFLLRFTDAIRSESTEQALIERAVRMLADELAVDRAYATRHYPAQDLTKVVYEVRGADLAPLPATLRFSDFPEAGRQTFERTLIFEDTANDQSLTEADKVALASMGVGALLSRPLRRDGSPIFALGVVSTLPRRWTPAEVALVEEAAERAWEAAERVRGEAVLREREERLRKVINAETVGIVFFDLVGGISDSNDAFLRMIGFSREEMEAGEVRYEQLTPPDWRWRDEQTIGELRATGRAGPYEKEYFRRDGSRMWILCSSQLLDADTAVEFVVDVTEAKRAEDKLRDSEERFRRFGEASQDILWMRDAGTLQWTYLTPAFETIYGLSREEALEGDDYRGWMDMIVPEDREQVEQSIRRVRAGEQVAFEYRIERPDDGRVCWLRETSFPISDGGGKVVAIGGIAHDVTELRESGQRARLLLAELQHRVRNIMAMIRSVARRTGDTTARVEDYVQHLEGRISAMARTQAMLTRDVHAAVDLESLILDELRMQAAQPQQYAVTGPDVGLPPKAAEVLGLALHELATNSVKYGALSERDGRIDVRWALLDGEDAPRLSLIWSEFDVMIDREPERRGFGTELVTQRVPYELNGTGTMEFRSTGLVATIEFPLDDRASILQTDEGIGVLT